MAEIETGREVRQGRKGQPVLYVLIAALVLAVIAGVGMLTWQGENAPAADHASQTPAKETAAGSSGGNPAAKEPPANPTNPAPAQPKAQ